MISEVVMKEINSGGALKFMDPLCYPARYDKKIPLRVRMTTTVVSEMPFFIQQKTDCPVAIHGNEFYVKVNSYGAVTAIFDDGRMLGLKPGEFEIIEYH